MDLDLDLSTCNEPARDPPPVPQALARPAWARSRWRCSWPGRSARRSAGRPDLTAAADNPLAPRPPQFPAKAKRVIYLHMSGAPPQQDLFDYKPELVKHNMQPCPDELLKNQRFAFIKGHPKLLGTPYKFQQHGQSGAWISELLPHIGERRRRHRDHPSMHTDQFNHAPAELFLYTGSPRNGGAAMGSWITYGLGSENQDLPGFVVLISGGTDPTGGKALWSTGFLPSGLPGRAVPDRRATRSSTSATPRAWTAPTAAARLDALRQLNEYELERVRRPRDPDADQPVRAGLPHADVRARGDGHPPGARSTSCELYGAEPGAASFANNCLLARRLVERGVRYVQLFDWGWDMPRHRHRRRHRQRTCPKKCKEVDRPIAALLKDLKQRGLLDETLVVWGGEFGRTSMNEARGGSKFLGRDHHPHCFTIWMAGGGIKPGITYGATDDLGYYITENPVSVHDLQATILHLLGLDAEKLRYPYQGLQQRLIGVEGDGQVRKELLA